MLVVLFSFEDNGTLYRTEAPSPQYNGNHQIRLRISPNAEAILRDDTISFREKNERTLANIILENYYEDATASICIQLEKYRSSIEEIYSESDTTIRANDIKILLSAREKELKAASEELIKLKKSKPWNALYLRNN